MFNLTDSQKIGVGLVGFGLLFLMLGVLLFFDSALLAMGNIMFLVGITLMIGFQNTISFFFKREKIKGTSLFFLGVVVVLLRWAMFGIIIESIGSYYLFSGFVPTAVATMRHMPIIGNLFAIPAVNKLAESVARTKPSV
eukprot:m.326568 g.326568  ORF g.326568 m.326568 type:complete len:139 (+) comp55576_c1_seq1:3228-3644(+)